jgi:hypothetical protein
MKANGKVNKEEGRTIFKKTGDATGQGRNSQHGKLTEGEGSVQLTSLNKLVWFSSAPFYIANMIYRFTKQAILMRRSTVLSHPVQ